MAMFSLVAEFELQNDVAIRLDLVSIFIYLIMINFEMIFERLFASVLKLDVCNLVSGSG